MGGDEAKRAVGAVVLVGCNEALLHPSLVVRVTVLTARMFVLDVEAQGYLCFQAFDSTKYPTVQHYDYGISSERFSFLQEEGWLSSSGEGLCHLDSCKG